MTHAQKRFAERYPRKKGHGQNWTPEETALIIKKITRLIKNYSPKVMFKRNAAGGASIYDVRIAGHDVDVVFDKKHNVVLTVLPKGRR